MKPFLKEIENRILVHDGSKGYMLQKLGLKGGECGESWNLVNQDAVREVYRSYLNAGSDVIQTNTFPGNRVHLSKYSLEDKTVEINYWGAKLAREVAGDQAYVCASIGPTGMLMEPSGELGFEKAFEVFREQVKAVADGGADVINFETFTDLAEMRAALLAAKEVTNLPVICSLAFENGGRTLMGTDPFVVVTVLKALGADMVGTNCSFGPEHMRGIVEAMYEAGAGYMSAKPNAGLPQVIDGKVVYDETADHFASLASEFVKFGGRLIGGCCGSTPEFIKALKDRIRGMSPEPVKQWNNQVITSNVRHQDGTKMDRKNIGILDVSKDASLADAIWKGALSELEDTALDLASEGYDAIYVNTDLEGIDSGTLAKVVDRVQWYVKDPLILETKDPAALEKALRIYRGVAGVITANVPVEVQDSIQSVVGKYGSVIIEPLK